MTRPTGKRSSRACLRCRQRKTRCNLGRAGESTKPPCVSCYDTGSECILVKSRRGSKLRLHQPEADIIRGPKASLLRDAEDASTSECLPDLRGPLDDGISAVRHDSGNILSMDLRNPSDALQILALSDQARSANHGLARSSTSDQVRRAPQGKKLSSSFQLELPGHHQVPSILDDYELIQRGLLGPSLVTELLHKYRRDYHPYCPIVPSRLLLSSTLETIQRSDYFLLTAILTIASRDDPRHSLTHRYCWDHTQRLLVDVLLAQPWTQTPATVEGLLILAEWLPHIQVDDASSGPPRKLCSEDRTAWSLVGLAVRHGYLQRLDEAAFPNHKDDGSRQRTEQDRLVWTHIYIADRQISVRLGQSFWSRGPSLAAKVTAEDFPSLMPRPENGNEDYASFLQASLELIQILHNAHAILYSSRERTLTMIREGHYSRYLDDFRNSATIWYSTWRDLAVPPRIRSTLLIMYEYVCLYTNAFSFQAVVTRASNPCTSENQKQQDKYPFTDLLGKGIMSSPDGRYIFDAITAAMNLLTLMNGLDPQLVLCYLPSRYYLYGVYAAVLLHKADCAGAFQSREQQKKVASLATKFIGALEKAPLTESHVCYSYSRMLTRLWSAREAKGADISLHPNETISPGCHDGFRMHAQPPLTPQYDHLRPFDTLDTPSVPRHVDPIQMQNDVPAIPSIEGYFLGSFMPGVADFTPGNFDADFLQNYLFGGERYETRNGELCHPGMEAQGPR